MDSPTVCERWPSQAGIPQYGRRESLARRADKCPNGTHKQPLPVREKPDSDTSVETKGMTVTTPTHPTRRAGERKTPKGESSCVKVNPDSKAATVAAIRAVTLYTIADAFDLHWQETAVVGYRLDDILSPLLNLPPGQVPFAVRRELLDHTYSKLIDKRQTHAKTGNSQTFDHKVLYASVDEWAETLLLPIFASYQLSPVVESRMHLELVALLKQLGVGHERNPRPAMYLPTDLRLSLMGRRHSK